MADRAAIRVAFAERPPELVQAAARAALGAFDLRMEDDLAETDVLLARRRRVGARELDAARPSLLIVLGRHPIPVDMRAANARGVPVRAIPHPGAIAVADHAMALLLAVARRIVEGDAGARSGAYRERGLTPAPTTERAFAFNWLGRKDIRTLDGLRLGLVGFGAIGQETARRASGFGMRTRYFQRHPLPAAWNRRLGATPLPFEQLLAESDVLSLHLPHTEATENLLDARALDRMPEGAILVNTARGGLVDEAALAERLRSGRLGGAGLDVFREEPLPADHPLLDAPNLALAPHAGGAGTGGQRQLFARVAETIAGHFGDPTP